MRKKKIQIKFSKKKRRNKNKIQIDQSITTMEQFSKIQNIYILAI